MLKFTQIKQLPKANYAVHVPLDGLELQLTRYYDMGLDADPDFQRGHVWTEDQQTAYVEWLLKGGESGLDICFNHPGWMSSFEGNFQLIDGKQRLVAVRKFLAGDLKICKGARGNEKGFSIDDFEDIPLGVNLIFKIFTMKTRVDVLRWYLAHNGGGTPHSCDELERVRYLLSEELKKQN